MDFFKSDTLTNEEVEIIMVLIQKRQEKSFDNARFKCEQYNEFFRLLFKWMNKKQTPEPYFYQGELYRIHVPRIYDIDYVNREEIIEPFESESDGNVLALKDTRYSDELVSFSKDYDFTKDVFYNVYPTQIARFFHCNTKQFYGLDVNKFYESYGERIERYEKEQEVLFPLQKEFVIKEYTCTPIKFKEYMELTKGK